MLVTSLLIGALTIPLKAAPDDLIEQGRGGRLSEWNFYVPTSNIGSEDGDEPPSGAIALSCLPEVNISLGLNGYAVITAATLVNAPQYPPHMYDVDIMGPLNDTVYCAQIGQELMVVVTELPTQNSCMSTVFVEDKLKPVLVCQSDTLPCNTDIASIDFESLIESVTDNCDNDVDLWHSYTIQNLPCNPHHFTQQINVTWTATDNYGNSTTCQDVIYLKKPALGQIQFPPNISLPCEDADIDPSNTGEPTYNGDPLGLTCQILVHHTDQTVPMCNGAYKILRTWIVKDWCNSGQVTRVQEILIVDQTPPVITCPANLTVNTGPGVCTTKYTLPLPVVSDACANASMIDIDIFVQGIPGIFSPGQMVNLGLGTTLITMRATDPCGNSTQCMYTVKVRDNTPPVLVCPPNVTIECTGSTHPSNTGYATAIDVCDPTPEITYSDVTVGIDGCALGYSIMRTWKAVDDSGNMITCMQMIELSDNTPPAIVCPPNITISCTASTAPAQTGSATATDACDNTPTITFTNSTTGGSCPQEYTLTRTWIATDDCGNSSTCNQLIFIQDIVPPSITCPPDITIECSDSSDPSESGFPTASDNCDPTPSFTYDDLIMMTGPQQFTINRTWEASDDCGNTSTCIQLILVHDDTPPEISCPNNITIACTASTLPTNTGTATATDNCDASPDISYSDQFTGGACPQEGTITRTWTATDDCGNTSTCIQTIFIDDATAPNITCPANVTIACTSSTLPGTTGSATATDNCDPTPSIDYNDVTAGGACPQEYTITRTWITSDDCGNSRTCTQVIVIDDSLAPVITCPANVTIQCSASTLPGNTGNATATDACDGSPAINFSDNTVAGDCAQEYTITRTWTAMDDCGNSSTCAQTIVIVDTQAPSITCPVNITIECDDSTLPPATGLATATDNCDNSPEITFSDATAGGSCPQELTITRTWTATDGCGNSTACVQVISVQDNTAPLITCPSNITIQCGTNTGPAATGTATATDNCDNTPNITHTDATVAGDCPQEYLINRTWVATDDCGNSSTCVQTISIVDTTVPVITCPANTTISCTASTAPGNTGSATATDNCDASPVVDFSDVTSGGTCPQEYTITRTWTATDDCGNTSACVQTIFIDDNIAPVVTCPANVTIQCTESTLPGNTGNATATDACDASPEVDFSDATVGGDCPQEYTITRTWTATDACGNTSTCIQTIFVQDTQAPAISCPANITINCEEGTLPDDTGFASATDNCDSNPEITFSDDIEGVGCEFTIVRTWTATDACGNSTACVQMIQVFDSSGPVISCPANVTIQCNTSTDPAQTGTATASDNCDNNPTIAHTDSSLPGTCPQEFVITRTWVATDDCGNSSSCTQVITVVDEIAPTITCPDNISIQCGEDTSPENTGTATASDNCDTNPSVIFDDVTIGGDCPEGYTITRTWVATDDCGNTSACIQIITVDDTQAPLISCPVNVTIDCAASTDPNSTGSATASDLCDNTPDLDFEDEIVNGACPQEFTVMRTWIATDNCGNSSTCLQMILLEDTTAPICQTQNITVSVNGAGTVTILPSQVNNGSSDDCGAVTLAVNPSTFTCDDLGANVVVLTVTDCPGNSSTCTAVVTVEDGGSLEASCQNVTIFVDANGNASVDPADVDNGSGGGCDPGDLEFDLSQTDFNCSDLGPNVVILTVTDEEGNTATCTAIITVVDNIPPTISCPANITVDCHTVTDPNNTSQFGNATGSDNCPPAIITETHIIDLSDCNVGTITRTFTATDGSGNTATCTQIVTVSNPDPLDLGDIDWPNSPIDVNICNSTDPDDIPNGEPVIDPTALLCADVDISFSDQVQTIIDNNPNTPCKIITRTWTVVDNCQVNGTFTFVQTINVQDPTPPVFTNINDMTKQANANCVAFFTLIASATDCAGVTITNNSPYGATTGANASGNYPIGVTVVIFTATDGCGNISTMDVVITVTDPNPTTFQCEKTIIFLPEETEIAIPADTFVTIIPGGCSGADDVIVSYSGTDPFDTVEIFDCGDVGVSTFPLWLWNEAGTMILDSCNTADLDLRDPFDYCEDGLVLSGSVENEDGFDLPGIEVSITNAAMEPDTTDQAGRYTISGLNEGTSYDVAPFNDEHHKEGVSTLDLVMIQKHLLGKAKLSSPYKIIAADANRSGNITALDLIEIRKLILGINERFQHNTSWRFVDREFSFADPYNPFDPAFPESIWIDSVVLGTGVADFVAIKTGDVNGSFFRSRARGSEEKAESGKPFSLEWRKDVDHLDCSQSWSLLAGQDQVPVFGYQFSLNAGLLTTDQLNGICSDILTTDHWYYDVDKQQLTISWSNAIETDLTGKVLISIPGLDQPLSLINGKDVIRPEVYGLINGETEVMSLEIDIKLPAENVVTAYQLFQNIPNPFEGNTVIRFAVPENELVTIAIHDVMGKLILEQKVSATTGMNEVVIREHQLGQAGVYYYSLNTQSASLTRKMSLTND
jgi:hypothetical protein